MSETAPRVVDFDAACTACGYNLRGLEGDKFSCPECGVAWTIESLRANRATDLANLKLQERNLIDVHVTRMCVGGDLLAIAVGAWVLLNCLWISGFSYFLPVKALGWVAAAVAVIGVCTFALATRGLRGRWIALFWQQTFAIPTVVLNIGAMAVGVVGVFAACSATEAAPACAILGVVALPFLILWTRPFRVLSNRGRAAIEALLQQKRRSDDEVERR